MSTMRRCIQQVQCFGKSLEVYFRAWWPAGIEKLAFPNTTAADIIKHTCNMSPSKDIGWLDVDIGEGASPNSYFYDPAYFSGVRLQWFFINPTFTQNCFPFGQNPTYPIDIKWQVPQPLTFSSANNLIKIVGIKAELPSYIPAFLYTASVWLCPHNPICRLLCVLQHFTIPFPQPVRFLSSSNTFLSSPKCHLTLSFHIKLLVSKRPSYKTYEGRASGWKNIRAVSCKCTGNV